MHRRFRPRLLAALTASTIVGLATSALAQVPTLHKPGEQTKVLAPLVGKKTKAGKKMPPMMPPVESTGTLNCAWTGGELWLACDLDEEVKGGKPFKRFRAHYVVGWDFGAKRYRAFIATEQGSAFTLEGKAEGKTLVLNSDEQNTPLGKIKIRWTFDFTDPKAIGFHDERSLNGMPWFTFEKTEIK